MLRFLKDLPSESPRQVAQWIASVWRPQEASSGHTLARGDATIAVSKYSNVQLELEIHFNGVVPASERRQIYSIAVYIFLPPGVESKETDRPFSHIWTSTKLHTPRVAIEHLCTHFAPVMLGGLFNASLQDVRNKVRMGRDASPQVVKILQQLYLQAAMYELALKQEIKATMQRLRHLDLSMQNSPENAAKAITAAVKHIIEAIQRLQQICGACESTSTTPELLEVWRRVHEHVLLSGENALLSLLECLDKYLSNQGVQLMQRAASLPAESASPKPSGQLKRAASEHASQLPSVDLQQKPQTLKDLLVQLAKGTVDAHQAPKPRSKEPQGPELLQNSSSGSGGRKAAPKVLGAQSPDRNLAEQHLFTKPPAASSLLGMRRNSQVTENKARIYGLDGHLSSHKAVTSIPPPPPLLQRKAAFEKPEARHSSILGAAARSMSNLRKNLQPRKSSEWDASYSAEGARQLQRFSSADLIEVDLRPGATLALAASQSPSESRSSGEGSDKEDHAKTKDLLATSELHDLPGDVLTNPFEAARAQAKHADQLGSPALSRSLPSKKSLPIANTTGKKWGSWSEATGSAEQRRNSVSGENELRSRLGAALLTRKTLDIPHPDEEACDTQPADGTRGAAATLSRKSSDLRRSSESAKTIKTAKRTPAPQERPRSLRTSLSDRLSGAARRKRTSEGSSEPPFYDEEPKTSGAHSVMPFPPSPGKATTASEGYAPLSPQKKMAGPRRAQHPLVASPFLKGDAPLPWETGTGPNGWAAGTRNRESADLLDPLSSDSGSHSSLQPDLKEKPELTAPEGRNIQSSRQTQPDNPPVVPNSEQLAQSKPQEGIQRVEDCIGGSGRWPVLPSELASENEVGTSDRQPSIDDHPDSRMPLGRDSGTSGLNRSASIVRGPLDQAEQLRNFAFQRMRTNRAIQYTAPPSPTESAAGLSPESSETSTAEEPKGPWEQDAQALARDSSIQGVQLQEKAGSRSLEPLTDAFEWRNPASVASRLRAARTRLLERRASTLHKTAFQGKPEGEKGFISTFSRLNKAFKGARQVPKPSFDDSFRGSFEETTSRLSQDEVKEDHLPALEVSQAGGEKEAEAGRGQSALASGALQRSPFKTQQLPGLNASGEPFVPYVKPKPKLYFGAGKRDALTRQKRRENVAGDILKRDDSVGALMYIHIPTPSPDEDIVKPLPSASSENRSKRYRKQISSSGFLEGDAAERIERQQTACLTEATEALQLLMYNHDTEKQPSAMEGGFKDSLPCFVKGFQGLQLPDALPCGPGEEQRIETILHALAHPKTAAKHNEPVLIGKSEKMGLPGEGTKAIGNKRSSQETPAGPSGHPGNSVKAGAPDPEAPRKELLRFWAKGSGKAAGGTLGLVSSTHEDLGNVEDAEGRRELQRARLKALQATRRQTGARFEMRRWGGAFRSVKGLAGVLRKARGLHLRQAEQPVIIEGSADALKTSAVMRQARMLICLSIQGFREERQKQGFQESFLEASGEAPDGFAARSALIARTGVQATSLTHKPVMPTPAVGDVFVWLFGLAAIAFCVAAIVLARKPLNITETAYNRAVAQQAPLHISNDDRVICLVLMALAIMGVWVFVLRDRWRSYEQSLNLLGVVARRGATLTDHTGKPVGHSEETFRRVPDKKLPSEVLQARYSHKGYLPSLQHPDRPETVLAYSRQVHLSWHLLESQMQAVDGIDFKTRVDLSPVLVALGDPTVTHQRLRAGKGSELPVVEDVRCGRKHHLQGVISVQHQTDVLRLCHQPHLHRVELTVQQSGIQAIEVLGDPSDLKHRRRASQSADAVQKSSASEGASAAFRSLLNKAKNQQPSEVQRLIEGV